MNQRILHRGPGATGLFITRAFGSTIFLGANRLAVQNTSSTFTQPYVTPDGCLIFNGEITNYKTLNNEKNEHSDTSALSHFLKTHCAGKLEVLVGMFAFVFYKKENQSLVIARDQHGVKPLYYYEDENYFIASSEIKGILSSGLVEKKLNSQQINHYLRFKYCKPPQTFFENISEFQPGMALTISLESGKKTYTSFQTATSKSIYSKGELISNIEARLLDSVTHNLSLAVPSGLLLSGGIDSTLLLAMIAKQGIDKYPCYIVSSSTTNGPKSPDLAYALKAAEQFGGDPRLLTVSEESLSRLPEIITALDQPIADSASLLTYLISEYASKDVKVLLSGAGADEYFAGYNRHSAFDFYLKHIKSNPLALTLLGKIPNLSKITGGLLAAKLGHLNKLKSSITADPYNTFMNFQSMNMLCNFTEENDEDEKWTLENAFQKALHYDRTNYLRSDVLAVTDIASMSKSIEVRVPYLDQNLTNFVETIYEKELINGGRKWILKSLLKKYNVSDKFINRPKYGFGLPFGGWIRKREYQYLLTPLMEQKTMLFEYADFDRVQHMLQEHKNRAQEWGTEIWALITLQIWLDKNF